MRFLSRILNRAPAARPEPTGDPVRLAEVETQLAILRPLFAADGGDVELVDVTEGRVSLRFQGACRSCFAQTQTLRGAVEPRLRETLPWFEELRVV